MMRKITPLILFFLLCSFASAASIDFAELYGDLLTRYVVNSHKDGIALALVDYDEWGSDPTHKEAMALLLSSDPEGMELKKEKLAYWINAYNFLTIDLIVREKECDSIKNLGTLVSSPWKRHEWVIHGKEYTLYDIEHVILRELNEPRIHMAIVCASISCANLRKEPYKAEMIEHQLKEQVKSFLRNKRKGLKLDGDTLYLSKIFKWYSDDFGGEKGVLSFVKQYYPELNFDDVNIEYLKYNWSLNSQ